jgi:tripartite ATP-independent transporter DctM subunit
VDFKQKLKALRSGSWEASIIFLLVIGGLISGFFTPNEAGAFGAVSVLLIGLIKKQIKWQGFTRALMETTRTTAMIFIFLAGVTVFGRFLVITRIPAAASSFAAELSFPPFVIMIAILVIYFIAGCFIDVLPFMLITMPVFYPLVISLGYDPIWFGVIMVCVCGMGGITPPVGIMVYVVANIAKDVPLKDIFRGTWPFFIALWVGIFLLMAFPQIATILPNLVMP